MSFAERLRERREELGMNQADLADILGVTKAAISNYENAISTPRPEILFNIFRALKCDANSLFQDELGDIINRKEFFSAAEKALMWKYRKLDSHGKESIRMILAHELSRCEETDEKRLDGLMAAYQAEYTKVIPLSGRVSAGQGIESIEEYDTITGPPSADFALIIDGDSMEPRFHDGQVIYVKQQPVLENGEIGVVQVFTEEDFLPRVFLKKIKTHKERAELISLNPAYDPMEFALNEISILGTII